MFVAPTAISLKFRQAIKVRQYCIKQLYLDSKQFFRVLFLLKMPQKKGKANGVLSEGLSEASGEMTTLARAPALLMRRSPEATNKC